MIAKETINVPCRICHNTYTLLVWPEKMQAWRDGSMYIQDALPDLTAGERELLISGTCDSCFNEMFGTCDDDEGDEDDWDDDGELGDRD